MNSAASSSTSIVRNRYFGSTPPHPGGAHRTGEEGTAQLIDLVGFGYPVFMTFNGYDVRVLETPE